MTQFRCGECRPEAGADDQLRDHPVVNGTDHRLIVDARTTLLVLRNGRRINARLMLAVMARGRTIATVEGVATDGHRHPMQQALIDHDVLQRRYCTPGNPSGGRRDAPFAIQHPIGYELPP
jgi:xanthine dehydrogenase YagT iron-sulfur-binding subunit